MADYIGNNDYRGWLNANPANRWALAFVGNDGGVNRPKFDSTYPVVDSRHEGYSQFMQNRNTAEQSLRDLYAQYTKRGAEYEGAYGGAGGGSAAGGTNSADELAYYDSQQNQLRDLLGRTQNTLNQGITNLTDSYNREVSGANQKRSRALEDFQIQREDTTRDKQTALGKVDTNARTLNDSLRRILGQASGSDSSAYQYAAPNAVAREASGKRNSVLSDYAENDRNISLSEKRATDDFQSLLDDLARQRGERERDLRTGVLESEQDLNAKLADVAGRRASAAGGGFASIRAAQSPYESATNDRRAQIDHLLE